MEKAFDNALKNAESRARSHSMFEEMFKRAGFVPVDYEPPPPSGGRINVWAEVKKHRGWYVVAFLLGGLPVGIATIWPTLTDKKIPQWLAEHGWPRLTMLVIAWVAIAAIIALVIVARSAQTALRERSKEGDEPR